MNGDDVAERQRRREATCANLRQMIAQKARDCDDPNTLRRVLGVLDDPA